MQQINKQQFIRKNIIMIIWTFLIIFLIAYPLTTVASEIDPNWDKASVIAYNNRTLLPLKIVLTEVTKNEAGKIEEEFKLTLHRHPEKKKEWESVLLNGIQVSNEEEKQILFEMEELFEHLEQLHPFGENTNYINKDKIKEREVYGNYFVRVFPLTAKISGKVLNGEILIEENTATPLQMRLLATDSYAEDGVLISNYTLTISYSSDPFNWHPISLTESMTLTAKTFPFLTWVGTHVSTTTFHDFK